MRYVLAKNQEQFEEKAYRIYVTSRIRAYLQDWGNPSYADIIDKTPPDDRSPDDIINHIKNGLRKI